tara:strand:+ start:19056 stop:19388 length:333 start_codon:yes stop_codon:yes gene_type:complete
LNRALANSVDQQIWQVVSQIPPGKVASYGDVAGYASLPGAARRVGFALRKLPDNSQIPWFRVVNSAGRISLPQGSTAYFRQKSRLEADGVELGPNDRIDLKRYRWRPGQG